MERTGVNRNQDRLINVVMQAFYGNRTGTEILPEEIDRFVLGNPDERSFLLMKEGIDRSAIRVPGTEQLVLVYNKYEEEKCLNNKEKYLRKGYDIKPLAVIPEMGIELFSRCIACRMDQDGNLKSLEREDYEVLWKYLAK